MNDTLEEKPVTFEWLYEINGQKIAGDKVVLQIEPGLGQEQQLAIQAPQTDEKLEGILTLKASQ